MKVARYVLAGLLLALSFEAHATRLYLPGACSPVGGYDTAANLVSAAPAGSFPCALGWSADAGEFYSDGTSWKSLVSSVDTSNIDFQSGLVTSIVGTKGTYYQIAHASTVDNMTASASALVCVTNPTIALLECGTSSTCSSPTTIASVQVTGTGAATPASVGSPAINAGDYVAWQLTGGICTSVNLAATAQMHSN